MRRMTATEAARGFADLLDSVERTGETVLVERRGKAVVSISPAAPASGRAVKELLRGAEADLDWASELAGLRRTLVTEDRDWND